jgi:hypothetical protein
MIVPLWYINEFVSAVPPEVQRGIYAEVPKPERVPEAVKVTELASIENEIPEPAKNDLYVKPDPPEFDDRKALPAFIAVSPVPPPVIPVTFNVLQAVPSYFQVFPFDVKIWFVVGDVGKSSAAINISN